jgi:hypothetical protein
MSPSKKIYLLRDFAEGVCLSEAQNPIPPLPYTLHTCIQYSILIHTGKGEGGGGLNQREVERGNSSQSWVENINLTDCISAL